MLDLAVGSVRPNLVRIPKPKPKLANSLDGYRNRYQNHISKEESSNQYIV